MVRSRKDDLLCSAGDIRAAPLRGTEDATDLNSLRRVLRQVFRRVYLVSVKGRLMLYPDAHPETFAVRGFYAEHGRLPELDQFEGTYGDVKRLPLPLEFAQSDYEGLASALTQA